MRPACDLNVTCMWPECDLHVTWMWPTCDLHATWMWPTCDLNVTYMWPECDLHATCMWPTCNLNVTCMRSWWLAIIVHDKSFSEKAEDNFMVWQIMWSIIVCERYSAITVDYVVYYDWKYPLRVPQLKSTLQCKCCTLYSRVHWLVHHTVTSSLLCELLFWPSNVTLLSLLYRARPLAKVRRNRSQRRSPTHSLMMTMTWIGYNSTLTLSGLKVFPNDWWPNCCWLLFLCERYFALCIVPQHGCALCSVLRERSWLCVSLCCSESTIHI